MAGQHVCLPPEVPLSCLVHGTFGGTVVAVWRVQRLGRELQRAGLPQLHLRAWRLLPERGGGLHYAGQVFEHILDVLVMLDSGS